MPHGAVHGQCNFQLRMEQQSRWLYWCVTCSLLDVWWTLDASIAEQGIGSHVCCSSEEGATLGFAVLTI